MARHAFDILIDLSSVIKTFQKHLSEGGDLTKEGRSQLEEILYDLETIYSEEFP